MSPSKGSYTVNKRRATKEDTDSDESSQRLTSSPAPPERPDSSATDDQNVNQHEPGDGSDGADSLDHQQQHLNVTSGGDQDEQDDQDASSDFIPKKLANGSDNSVDHGMSALTKNELMIQKAYLFLRLVLGTLNLTSFILKVPLLLLILRIAVELSQQKKRESMVTTIEPPYEDDTVAPVKDASADKRAIVVEALILLVLYVSLLLVHILCVFAFWLNKGVFHLFLHLPLVGLWLFLAITSYFVIEWRWALKIIFLVFQALVHGNDILNSPTNTESLLLRISIWFDLVTVVLSVIYIFAFFKLKKQLKTASCSCNPHYNLLQCL